MDFNEKPTNSTPALTAEIAGQVYELIKEFGDVDKAYKLKGDSSIDPEHFDLTNNELDRLVRELREFKNGKLLEAEVFHFNEETGEKVIDSEAVYYEYTTDEDLAKQVTSELLNVATIIEDVLNK